MRERGRFLTGLVVVTLAVGYLVWTGMRETMVYYLTLSELMAKVGADPSFREVGVKVGERVVPGTLRAAAADLHYAFEVRDAETDTGRFPVLYRGPLPDTFKEGGEVVLEGRFRPDGVFEAVTVPTKCGSRYEAAPEQFSS